MKQFIYKILRLKKWIIYFLALLGLMVIIAWIIGIIASLVTKPTCSKSENGKWVPIPCIDSQSIPSPSPYIFPTPISNPPRINVSLPKKEVWVKYLARCKVLTEANVYYPQSWKIGVDGEQSITDGYEGTKEGKSQYDSQCLIQFGYPVAPNGRQDSYVRGLYGEILVKGQNLPISPDISSLSEYVDMYRNDDDVAGIFSQTINQKEWKTIWYKRGDIRWLTVNHNKIYEVYLLDNVGNQELNPVSAGYMRQIAEGIVHRIEFK